MFRQNLEVLVIEDNPADVTYLIEKYIKPSGGMNVFTCSTLKEAKTVLSKERFDCVLLDISLPDSFGTEGIKELRRINPILPIILLTGFTDQQLINDHMAAGADDYLPKFEFNLVTFKSVVSFAHQRAKHKEDVQSQEQKMTFMMKQLPAVLWMVNKDFKILTAWGKAEEILGIRPEDLIGLDIQNCKLEGAVPISQVWEHHRSAINGIATKSRVKFKNKWLEIIVEPAIQTGELVRGALGMALDVTETVLSEARLQAIQREAVKANQAKSRFLANMSHEIRTPLNGIIGASELLVETNLTAEAKSYADIILQNSKTLYLLISDILDLSKIESNAFELKCEPIHLKNTISSVLTTVSTLAATKPIEFVFSYADDLSNYYLGDSRSLRQILLNLLSNAIKYTDRGRVTISVSKGSNEIGNSHKIRLAVADTGIGIQNEKLSLIFEEFQQVHLDRVNRSVEGTGLGLAITRHLIEKMNGTISVTSSVGQGSTFVCEFPLTISNVTHLEHTNGVVDLKTLPKNSGQKLLLVDDQRDNRFVLGALLTKYGFKIDFAEDGIEGLEKINQNKYDLVLMDMYMPRLDGFKTVQQLRAKEKQEQKLQLPVIALTASALEEERTKCLEVGCNDFVTKPVRKLELLEAINKWVCHEVH